MKKIRKNTKIGGITALGSVSFMVGWLDVGWLDGWICFFFHIHTPAELTIYPSSARSSLAPLGKNVIIIYRHDIMHN